MWRPSGPTLIAAMLWLGGLWLSGCATYSSGLRTIELQLAAQQPAVALKALESQHHKRRDELLYLFNKGMLLRMAGQLESSNKIFENAKQLMKRLYGISVREQATSLVINDATSSYTGDEYEQVLLYVYKIFNYLELGQQKQARVEARQMDVRFRELGKSGQIIESVGRHIAGLVFEAGQEWNDAMVAYRKAYFAYKRQKKDSATIPYSLQLALLRVAERQGLKNEVRSFKKEFGIDRWDSTQKRSKQGEIILILHSSLAPIKREHSVMQSSRDFQHLVRISLPYYIDRDLVVVSGIQLEIANKKVTGDRIADVGKVARQTLDKKMGAIVVRAIARAVIKAEIAKEARKEARNRDSPLLGLIAEIAIFASERADTRSWTTLPSRIYLARMSLPPGKYALSAALMGRGGSIIHTHNVNHVDIIKGQYTFVNIHWIPPGIRSRSHQ